MKTETCSHLLYLLLLLLQFSLFLNSLGTAAANITDTLDKGRNITDDQTLVSSGGSFTLGFFSLGVPSRRYLGIWFSVSKDTVYWVANRDRPLSDNSGVLVLGDTGSLLLLDSYGQIVWSSNKTSTASAVTQLLESGNLVVRDRSSGALLWQSFDHPSNTMIPGMKIGKDLWTGAEWYLSSWRSADDPSTGDYRRVIQAKGEGVTWEGNIKKYRTGPWNGMWFNGAPEMASYADMFNYQLTSSPSEITYSYNAKVGTPFSQLMLTEAGMTQRLVWDPSTQAWKLFYQAPRDACDDYAKCGAFGLCNANAASTSFCSCMKGFSPVTPSEWNIRETADGCRRNVPLDCSNRTTTDGFFVVRSVKLPDTQNVSVDASIMLDECGARCLANCSCVAYAAADIRGGGGGSGCTIWTDDLVDVRYVEGGQDLYVRLAKSELDAVKTKKLNVVVIAAVAVMCTILFLLLGFLIWKNLRHRIAGGDPTFPNYVPAHMEEAILSNDAMTVASIDLSTVQRATRNFSKRNVIGRGAFGIIYAGKLPNGHPLVGGLPAERYIAVKRLIQSALPERAISDFRREVEVMSKLRHNNLVGLLAYCNEDNERILVYEYMRRSSLDVYILGKSRRNRALLNWEKRLEIIHGIAQGVMYLHEGSGENVIHRDLKPSNVLLDDNWSPKIGDFGAAKLFVDNQTKTQTIIGSPGYMAPEYRQEGDMTLKCDIYSFGVTLLEIISGRSNSAIPSLLSHAWRLWEEHRAMDLLDPAVARPNSEPKLFSKVCRCIQIGLLCVQESPDARPTISQVVPMLISSNSRLDLPDRPALGEAALVMQETATTTNLT